MRNDEGPNRVIPKVWCILSPPPLQLYQPFLKCKTKISAEGLVPPFCSIW